MRIAVAEAGVAREVTLILRDARVSLGVGLNAGEVVGTAA